MSDDERLATIRRKRASGDCLGELFDAGYSADEIVQALGIMPLAHDLGLIGEDEADNDE